MPILNKIKSHPLIFDDLHFTADWFSVSHDMFRDRTNGFRSPRGVTRSPSGIFAPFNVQLRDVSGSVATASNGVLDFTSAVKFSRRMFVRMESWFPTKRSGFTHLTLKFLNVTSRTPRILMPGPATIYTALP